MSHLDEKINAVEEMTELESLQFFQTQSHSCSYLDNKIASTVFLDPRQNINQSLYSQLSEYGFRRSGAHIYKPLCNDCNACVPMRIPAALFKPSRSQKRTLKRNADLQITMSKNIDTEEHYQLYESYIEHRHKEGDMYPPSRDQFREFLACKWESCHYYEYRLDGKLLAVSVSDIMDNGISAVYTYYEPFETKRSLGSFVILFLIEEAKKRQLDSVYLGYWIKNSSKMNYKSAYRPLEIQSGNRWLRLD